MTHPTDRLTPTQQNAITTAIVKLIDDSGASLQEARNCLEDVEGELVGRDGPSDADLPTAADTESRDRTYRAAMIDAGRGHLLR